MNFKHILLCFLHLMLYSGSAIFVDYGNPYTDKPLKVGELTISVTAQKSPMHTKAYFPQETGEYPAVLFFGGLNTVVLAEFYETILLRIASHGFFVFGLDYSFPVEKFKIETELKKQDISKFFQQFTWLQNFMKNKTEATVVWNSTALVCHSSGCDVTLKMIRQQPNMFNSTVFLEPFSYDINDKVNNGMPAFMYGTELSEKGKVRCIYPGYDYNKFYDIWGCPKLVWNVANFGHCDMLDPVPWTGCKDTHFCTITPNVTAIPEYREFVQGAVSSFLVSSLQGRSNAMKFITDKSLIPFPLLEFKSDLNCAV